MIEVRQARYFLALAEHEHFGRAAKELGMSQPPLSQAIIQLERQLRVRLVDRSGRRIKLTETGRVFAEECRKVVAAAQHARDAAVQAEAGLRGTLRIGLVTAALSEPLLSTLKAFGRARPQVELRISEVDSPQGQRQLLTNEIDLAFIRLSSPPRELRATPWRRDHVVVALPQNHRLAMDTDQPIELAALAEDPWVWPHRNASPDYHDLLMATCRTAGFTPNAHHFAHTVNTQLKMVAAGLGVTLVPSYAAVDSGLPLRYRPLTDTNEVVDLSLVSRDSPHEPLVREFRRVAEECRSTMGR